MQLDVVVTFELSLPFCTPLYSWQTFLTLLPQELATLAVSPKLELMPISSETPLALTPWRTTFRGPPLLLQLPQER